jgi:hypothetical protein
MRPPRGAMQVQAEEGGMTAVAVEKGMLLLYENVPNANFERPTRYELLTVTAVRKTAGGVTAKLLRSTEGATVEYTTRFAGGVVAEPFKLFGLSQGDLKLVWSKT